MCLLRRSISSSNAEFFSVISATIWSFSLAPAPVVKVVGAVLVVVVVVGCIVVPGSGERC